MITPKDYKHPDWESAGRVHEWKNYISEEIKHMWPSFTDEQQQAISRQAKENSDNEEWD